MCPNCRLVVVLKGVATQNFKLLWNFLIVHVHIVLVHADMNIWFIVIVKLDNIISFN